MGAPGSHPGPGGTRPARWSRLRARTLRSWARAVRLAGPGRSARRVTSREAAARMLRLLHTADVHLGARHADLGDAAATQRERQFAAFVATVDLAIAERVDLVLVAGDLFDCNVQPRRSVERVAARARPPRRGPDPDGPDPGHARRLRPLVGLPRLRPRRRWPARRTRDGLVTVLTPERPWVHLDTLDAVVHGPVFATKRAPHSPLRDLATRDGAGRDLADRRSSMPPSPSRAGRTATTS